MQVQNVDYQSAEAAQQFTRSLCETGFGVIRNHPVSRALVERIYRQWQDFFESDECNEWIFDPRQQDGYFPPDISEKARGQQLRDLKAYYHVYPWGRVPPTLRPDIEAYYQQVQQLAGELLGWIERCTPGNVAGRFSEPLSHMIHDSQQTLLRILYYPALTGDETPGAVRAAAHEDINLITVLPASNQAGLEVQDRHGHWLQVPCDPGQLIINVGDMLQEASDGYYPSTTHRVVNPDSANRHQPRLSLPLFLHPRPEVTLSSRYSAKHYLEERLRELGVL